VFDSADTLAHEGFRGFVPLSTLDTSTVPAEGGVYVVLATSAEPPTILVESRGGHFKGRDPGVEPTLLEARWVPQTPVLYIGKAGSLRNRLRQFRDFGNGKPVGHWGGRYLWQVEGCERFLIAWRTCSDEAQEESRMIREFAARFGRPPFANIASGVTVIDQAARPMEPTAMDTAMDTPMDGLHPMEEDGASEDLGAVLEGVTAAHAALGRLIAAYDDVDPLDTTPDERRRLASVRRLLDDALAQFD